MQALYLHGFASSPGSGKANFLAARFAARGIGLERPDLNLPDFSTLTITRMLDQADAAIDALPPGPVVLIGSSMGGLVALHAAERRASRLDDRHPVSHLVLFAPALDFGFVRDPRHVPERIADWRRSDCWNVFHHHYGREVPVHFALWEDAGQYDALTARCDAPTLIMHGTRDTVVDPLTVSRFAEGRPNVRLCFVDDDHQLQGHLDEIWAELSSFIGLPPH